MPLIRKDPSLPPTEPAPETDPFAGLHAASADARWAAARALAGLPSGVAALAGALAGEKDSRVRDAIFASLARAATRESAEAVLPSLRSDDAGRRTGALDALRAMPAAAAPLLPQLLADPDPDVRLLTCEVVRALPPAEASALLGALLDREPLVNVCAAAVDVLAEAGDASVLPALRRCAERFQSETFLGFAIRIAARRIESSGARG